MTTQIILISSHDWNYRGEVAWVPHRLDALPGAVFAQTTAYKHREQRENRLKFFLDPRSQDSQSNEERMCA